MGTFISSSTNLSTQDNFVMASEEDEASDINAALHFNNENKEDTTMT